MTHFTSDNSRNRIQAGPESRESINLLETKASQPIDTSPLEQLFNDYEELLRNQTNGNSAEHSSRLNLLRSILEDRLLHSEQASVEVEQSKYPVIFKILRSLADAPKRPIEISEGLGHSPEVVNRALRTLLSEGFVEVSKSEVDKRGKIYALTPSGVSKLVAYRSLGRIESQAVIDQSEIAAYLSDAIGAAVVDRRTWNMLESSIERLESIVLSAEAYGLRKLEIRSRRELATSLRQAQKLEQLTDQISVFEAMAKGERAIPAELVVPAYAHWKYESGKLSARFDDGSLKERESSLIAARDAYKDLMVLGETSPSHYDFEDWSLRYAWSVVGLADNHVEQTNFGEAVQFARNARDLFVEVGDQYGETHSLFVEGFGQKLRGQFDSARFVLNESLQMALDHSFHRHIANSLLQLGDVERCQGNLVAAQTQIELALEKAISLKMTLTQGFAWSALGAVQFHLGALSSAEESFQRASACFAEVDHSKGMVLNQRRMAELKRTQGRWSDATALALAGMDHYRNYVSPAGYAHCALMHARVAATTGAPATRFSNYIMRLIARPTPRYMLELDPWFAPLLYEFAKQYEDEDFAEASRQMLSDFQVRRRENASEQFPIQDFIIREDEDQSDLESVEYKRDEVIEESADAMVGEVRYDADRPLQAA